MAFSKMLNWLRMWAVKPVLVVVSFRPNGASGIVASSTRGPATVARDGVGLYTVTFDEVLGTVLGMWADFKGVDGDGLPPTFARLGPYVSASKTLKVFVVQEGGGGGAFANVDMAADADNIVTVCVLVDESSARPKAR